MILMMVLCITACSRGSNYDEDIDAAEAAENEVEETQDEADAGANADTEPAAEAEAAKPMADISSLPGIGAGETAQELSLYTDANGDTAVIPSQFTVSGAADEQTVNTGLVIIGPDESEYVWVPTTDTELAQREFGSYFSGGGGIGDYSDDTQGDTYQAMEASCRNYGGFYISRYEVSVGSGHDLSDYIPASKRIDDENSGQIWVTFSPQAFEVVCGNLYADNDTVAGFFPWGANWDTTLQWIIDSGAKTEEEVTTDSTSWGNYSDDPFSKGAGGAYTGMWEETKANNIYDLAGNNWEWTNERFGENYVMRGGGYSLMGGNCQGSRYPAALRDPLPGNNHHPNVTFRSGLYIK